MRPPRPPLDGLQRCLCPRLNSQFLNQIAFPNALTTAAALRHVTTTTTTTAARIPANERKPKSYRNDTGIQAPDGAEKPVPKPLDAKARHSRALARISAHLRAVPRNPPASVVSLLTDMAVRKEVALTLNLYEAIIPLANIETALVLLEDMKRRRISPSSRVYHSILRLLNNVWKGEQQRKAVLDEMKERWITLLPEGEEAVLIGRIRDRETRLVNEMLEEWRKRGKNPTALVWRVQVKQLLSAGRLSEAAELFRRAVAQADEHDTGVKIWDIWRERREGEYWKRNIYDLLRLAAEERNYAETVYAFNYALTDPVYGPAFNPDSGLLLNILYTAARHGDHELAEQALAIHDTSVQTRQQHHWAALLESYLRANELSKVLQLLSMMRSLHCPATIGTVTSLAALLPAGSGPGALELFKALPAKNRDPAAIHLILKSLINDNNLALAIEVYKTIPELVPHHPELPSTDTYNILLRGCVSAKSRDTAILLLREMVTRGNVVMDADTYDSLISVALVAVDEANPDSWFDAFTYLQEMKKDGMTPGRATYVKLALGTGARGQGDMAKEVVREMRAAGWQVDKLLTYIHKWDRAKGGNPALGSEGGRVQRLEGTG